MATLYTRNDTSNNIANDKIINATDLDGEFDAIETGFYNLDQAINISGLNAAVIGNLHVAGDLTVVGDYGDISGVNADFTGDLTADAGFISSGPFTVDNSDSDSLGLVVSNTGGANIRTYFSDATVQGETIIESLNELNFDCGTNLLTTNSQGFTMNAAAGDLTINAHNIEYNATTSGSLYLNTQAGSFLYMNASANIPLLSIKSDFGGVETVNAIIYTDGDIANTNNNYGAISDLRLKENITDAKGQLEDLNKLRVVNYNLKNSDLKQIGLVAQEVLEVKPGLVRESEDGFYSIKYSVLVPILLKALQELTQRVEQLENK